MAHAGDQHGPVDLGEVPLHLGLGSTARVVEGFAWTPEALARYSAETADDGDEGRLVMTFPNDADWTSWERHPGGEEVVVLLSGRADLIQRDEDETERRIELQAGQAIVNPKGAWHTVDVHEPGRILTITPGRGTEHEPR